MRRNKRVIPGFLKPNKHWPKRLRFGEKLLPLGQASFDDDARVRAIPLMLGH